MMSTIKGYDNTAAQEYADYQGYEFISLGEPAVGEIAGGKITDTINWSFDTEGLLTITGSGKIPNYNSSDNPVPWSTFSNSVKSVVVADGITAIGNYNFYNCDLLTSVTLPDTLTSIGSYAFCSCDSLTEILLHYNVTTIGNGALSTYAQGFVLKGYKYSYAEEYANNNFVDFESIGNAPCITVAEGSCGANVKWTYDNYKTLTLSGSGKTVDLESYSSSQPDWQQYRSYIKKVVVGKGIENIGNYLFKGTSSLEEVEMYVTVTSIGTSAFFNCSNLKTVTIPASVTTIASSAFSQCPSDMVIKGYIPSVAYDFATSKSYTFTSLGNLPETEIASGDCGDNVKWSLSNYGKLTISGKGTMEFEDNSSGGNAGEDSGGSIGGIVVGGDSYAGVLSIDYNDVPWYSYASKIKSVVIGEGIANIADYAFYGLTKLTEITLPDTLVSIGEYSFRNCSSLTTIVLPESVQTIGKYAFAYCTNLKEITIHYNVNSIGNDAFRNSPNVVINGYEESKIYEYAQNNNIIFVSIGTAPVRVLASGNVNENIIWSFNSKGLLKISGTGDMPYYENAQDIPWFNYMSAIKTVEISGVDTIRAHTFINCTELSAITLNGVKTVGRFAFESANYVTEIYLPETIEMLDRNSFGYLSESVTIKGKEGTYAQMYAQHLGCNFVADSDAVQITEVTVSTIEELIANIKSNTTIIVEDGIYVLDRTARMDAYGGVYEYLDALLIENVTNLTIKAKNKGMVELISPQNNYISYFEYENAPIIVKGAYNLTLDGLRIGNMKISARNGSIINGEGVELLGGEVDDTAVDGYNGAYFGEADEPEGYLDMTYPIAIQNKANIINCDIFNNAYGIEFSGILLNLDNTTVRDNTHGAIYAYSKVNINNSVFSNNGCNSKYKAQNLLYLGTNSQITGCTFINNANASFVNTNNITQTNNVFSNNGWNSQTPKAYGITPNGITWQIADKNGDLTLKLGYDVVADMHTFESEGGTVYPYSVNSAPWRAFDIKAIDAKNGVVYENIIHGGCGKNVKWQFEPETSTLKISGIGDMSNIASMYLWSKYSNQIENIEIADTVTGVYNIFGGTKFTANSANWENGVINGTLYIGDVLIRANYQAVGEFKVKEGTRVIAEEAFYNIDNIKSIILPESVKYIGVHENLSYYDSEIYGAFSNCSLLESISIPKSVTIIDDGAFYNCAKLSRIYYGGTKEDWDQVLICDNNSPLERAVIYYTNKAYTDGSGISYAQVSRVSDKKIVVNIDGEAIQGSKVYVVCYNGNGGYVANAILKSDGTFTYEASKSNVNKVSVVKVFVWKNNTSLKPLAKPVTISLKK